MRPGRSTPDYLKHLIYFTEYPDLQSRGWIEESDKLLFLHKWDDVLKVLQETRKKDAKVVIFPNADIQYYGNQLDLRQMGGHK